MRSNWLHRVSRGAVIVTALTGLMRGAPMPAAWSQEPTGSPEDSSAGPVDEEHQRRIMARYERMIHYNLESAQAVPADDIDARMAEMSGLEMGDRIAGWAEYFYQRGDARYLYGRDPGGYVTEGRLVDDFATDCVLFFCRVTELGRSTSALEAVQFAFGTRFLAGSLEQIVNEEGRVDYDNPVHLDYTEDMIRSGIWGADITAEIGLARPDPAGTSRYEPGSISFVRSADVDFTKLRNGDVIFFVSDEKVPAGQAIRATGAIIGHVGIARIEGGEVYLIHPAAKPLPGVYTGGRIEKVLLRIYLARVDTFKGVIATRISNF
jgi:hypothetical protein